MKSHVLFEKILTTTLNKEKPNCLDTTPSWSYGAISEKDHSDHSEVNTGRY